MRMRAIYSQSALARIILQKVHIRSFKIRIVIKAQKTCRIVQSPTLVAGFQKAETQQDCPFTKACAHEIIASSNGTAASKRRSTLTNKYRENLALDCSCNAIRTSKVSGDCQPDKKAQRHDILS